MGRIPEMVAAFLASTSIVTRSRRTSPTHYTYPPAPDRMMLSLHHLDQAETNAVDAAVEGYRALAATLPPAFRDAYPVDLSRASQDEAEALLSALDAVTSAVVHRAVGHAGAARDPELGRLAETVRIEAEALANQEADGPDARYPVAHDFGLATAAERLTEAALEELDTEMRLGMQQPTRKMVLSWERQSQASVHVKLLERLFHRLELMCFVDPLLLLERDASQWHFERFSTPGKGKRAGPVEFARGVREQEWSLVDRPSLALELSLLEAFILSIRLGDPCPEKQARLARALVPSTTGLFRVEQRRGEEAVLHRLGDGKRFRVQEHNPETDYDVGALAMGRVVEVTPDLCIRSPGMVMINGPFQIGDELPKDLMERPEHDRAIQVESVISILAFDNRKIPRRVPPAPSRTAAEERLRALHDELEAHDLVETVGVDEAPAELLGKMGERLDPEVSRIESIELDESVAEWLTALMAMARPANRTGKESGGSKNQGKKKRRRR